MSESNREQLARLLKSYRVREGFDESFLARRMTNFGVKISEKKVRRIEEGSEPPTAREVSMWAISTCASNAEGKDLEQLASRARLDELDTVSKRGGSAGGELARLLKRLRVCEGFDEDFLARRMTNFGVKISRNKVCRVEEGSEAPSAREVSMWAISTCASNAEREHLEQLASRARLDAL